MEEILKKILTKVEKIDSIENRLDKMDNRFDKMDGRLDKMDGRFDNLEGRFDNLDSKVDRIDSQQKENTSILKALEHKAEVHKAELDKLNFNIAKMSGEVKGVQKEVEDINENMLIPYNIAINIGNENSNEKKCQFKLFGNSNFWWDFRGCGILKLTKKIIPDKSDRPIVRN